MFSPQRCHPGIYPNLGNTLFTLSQTLRCATAPPIAFASNQRVDPVGWRRIRGTRIAATERGEAETAYAEARAYYRRVAAEAVAP